MPLTLDLDPTTIRAGAKPPLNPDTAPFAPENEDAEDEEETDA